MKTPEEKKYEYWNHLVAKLVFPNGITPTRLNKLKTIIWEDVDFWDEIIWRHGGNGMRPHVMEKYYIKTYEHCEGNFWGSVVQIAIDKGILRKGDGL